MEVWQPCGRKARQRVNDAFADARENVPPVEVFKRLRDRHAARTKISGE